MATDIDTDKAREVAGNLLDSYWAMPLQVARDLIRAMADEIDRLKAAHGIPRDDLRPRRDA